MKKNWLLIALCLGFIVAWQVFVVTPYNKAHAPAPSTTTSASSEVAKQNTSQAAPANSPTKASPSIREISPEFASQAKELTLSSNRTIKVYPNGLIGDATFHDYKTRGKDQVDVQFLKNGLLWSSNNAAIEECLKNLKIKESTSTIASYEGQAQGGTCFVKYESSSQVVGLVQSEITISGFNVEAGQALLLSGAEVLGKAKNRDDHNTLFVRVNQSIEKLRDKEFTATGTLIGKVDWASFGDRYFTSVFLPKGSFNPNIKYGMTGKDNEAFFAAEYPLSLDASKNMKVDLDLYFGVKDPATLTSVNPTLYQAVDLGWMGSVARVMLWALKSIYKTFSWISLGNFGLAIIFLTLVVRAAFWPLNKKVFHSSQKMKELAPQIQKIKEKYGNDRSQMEQLNRETMALYKKNQVNPMGSCLPLLLQMPIFIGLYGALSHSLDLYQAPFFGWIHDLSSPDQYYVLPALWTLTLLGYTFLNPTQQQAGMPDMKWMMIGMNAFFGYLSKDWPSGLTLYLFVSNLVGISQQFMFQRAGKKLQPLTEGA